MNNIINKELLSRIVSAIIFIPTVILPLIFSNYFSVVVYLLFITIILIELNEVKKNANKGYLFNIYLLIALSSFYLFLLLLMTEKLNWSYLVLVIFIIWTFDTFSYIGGKIIGGKKLMPKISSGKTISSLISGILVTLLIFGLIYNSIENLIQISLFNVLVIILFSFIGDTTVSMLKRNASIKDSGNIMPGHGGLLDRFDSFIMVFFMVGILNLIR